jgi:hypothetical protein
VRALNRAGFYHNGRFATLSDVVEHYNTQFDLRLGNQQKTLIEYLKGIEYLPDLKVR